MTVTCPRYDSQRVVQQLRACGVLETVRISAAGYPSRWGYAEFYQRYHALLPRGRFRKGEESAMAVAILHSTIEVRWEGRQLLKFYFFPLPPSLPLQSSDLYQLGRTKVFFRAGQVAYLERLRQSRLHACGLLLQKNVRAWLARTRYLRLKRAVIWLQRLGRGCLARRQVWFLE